MSSSERRQVPADHRPETEAWVDGMGRMKIGEVGNIDAWISSDHVAEVEQ